MLHKFEARRYIAIGLAGLVLLAANWVAPKPPIAQAAQQMQRFPAMPGAPSNLPTQVQMPSPPPDAEDALSQKQKSALVTANFKKTKQDAAKLCKLAESLEKEVSSSNPNVLSLHVVQSAAKIEKLAKKIKNEAKDY